MKNIIIASSIFLTYIILIALISIVLSSNIEYGDYKPLIFGIYKLLSIIIILIILIRKNIINLDFNLKKPSHYLITVGLVGLLILILLHYSFSSGSSANVQLTIQIFLNAVLPIIIIAPIGEELIFRNGIQKILAKRYNIHLAIIITAVFFALDHLYFTATFPILIRHFLAGITLGYCYHFSKTIIVPICVHLIFNTLILFSII